jgi:hypothetical protein
MSGIVTAAFATLHCALCGSDALFPVAPAREPSAISVFTMPATEGVNVLIAGQKTAAPRSTDTIETARQERLGTIKRLVRLREKEDVNFVIKTRNLARRMLREPEHFAGVPTRARPTTGAEFLGDLTLASRRGPIKNLVVFGHAASTALYMIEDRGFYGRVTEIAKLTSLVSGTDVEKEEKLRNLGARDLSDLELLIREGKVRFAKNAVIIFAGCGVAGTTDIESDSIASRLAAITNATIIASIGVTDQSMSHARSNVPDKEYSRGTWVRFLNGAKPQKLHTKVMDPFKYLQRESVSSSMPEMSALPDFAPVNSILPQLRCALLNMSASESRSMPICGANFSGSAIAEIGIPTMFQETRRTRNSTS